MARGEPMRCPSCGSRLVELERSDVLSDACPTCRGAWLDRGELDKILVIERRMERGSRADDDFFGEMEGRRRPERQHPAGTRASTSSRAGGAAARSRSSSTSTS